MIVSLERYRLERALETATQRLAEDMTEENLAQLNEARDRLYAFRGQK